MKTSLNSLGNQSVPSKSPSKTAERPLIEKKFIPRYEVIIYNDDVTTMDFVVEILIIIFHFTQESAERLMLEIHQKGKSVVGLYPKEIAETKVSQVLNLAKINNFPLKITYRRVAE